MARCSMGFPSGQRPFFYFIKVIIYRCNKLIVKGGEHKLLEDLKPIISNLEERIYGMRDSL